MFAAKQVIEGKIFIHHRRDKMLTVFHRHEVPAQYFECFINAQNFTGHFVEIHAQPADQVRVVYIKKNSTHQIIAMLNQSQYVLHLHPLTLILGKWSFRHRVLPNTLKIFAGLFALLFILFQLPPFQQISSSSPPSCETAFNSQFLGYCYFCCALYCLLYCPMRISCMFVHYVC